MNDGWQATWAPRGQAAGGEEEQGKDVIHRNIMLPLLILSTCCTGSRCLHRCRHALCLTVFATGASGNDSLEQRNLCAAVWHVSDCLLLTSVNKLQLRRYTTWLLSFGSSPSAALTDCYEHRLVQHPAQHLQDVTNTKHVTFCKCCAGC